MPLVFRLWKMRVNGIFLLFISTLIANHFTREFVFFRVIPLAFSSSMCQAKKKSINHWAMHYIDYKLALCFRRRNKKNIKKQKHRGVYISITDFRPSGQAKMCLNGVIHAINKYSKVRQIGRSHTRTQSMWVDRKTQPMAANKQQH